jgi:hypothetical protein
MIQSSRLAAPTGTYGLMALTAFLLPILLIGLPFILGMLMLNGMTGLAVTLLTLGGAVIFGGWIAAIID